jgi:hypothetical protein
MHYCTFDPERESVIVHHTAGFFSCCNVRVVAILQYCIKYGSWPKHVDSSAQFCDYKVFREQDVTLEVFQPPLDVDKLSPSDVEKEYTWNHQFRDYHAALDFTRLTPVINSYFRFTEAFYRERVQTLLERYALVPERTCVVRFRGNDKCTETAQPSYESVLAQVRRIKAADPTLTTLLVQTDETEFMEAVRAMFPDAVAFQETPSMAKQPHVGIHHVMTGQPCLDAVLFFVASMYILSKCKHVVCTSGNGECFMALWRGHARGICQFLNGKWYDDGDRAAAADNEER